MLPSDAWLLKIETDSILIKEKRKHLSKTSDRVSKKMKRKRLSLEKEESIHRSIYRYTKVNSLSYISPVVWGVLERESKSDRGDV
jgi:hypothetical protein